MPPPKKIKNLLDTKKFITMVANKQGWKLNSDEEIVQMLIEGLTSNYNTHGYYLCPCRDSWELKEKDKDVICPCDYCVPDQKEFGHCFCALYLTNHFYNSGKIPEGIPERRPEELSP